MKRPPIPPQAYTRETLSEAYEWVSTQPDYVKSRAKTVDTLVSLYLSAKRNGQLGSPGEIKTAASYASESTQNMVSQDSPVSIQHFQSDLKHLAKGIQQFDDESQEFYSTNESNNVTQHHAYPPMHTASDSLHASESPNHHVRPAPLSGVSARLTERVMEIQTTNPMADPACLKKVQWVQRRFNLSSLDEAVRMLITIGFERIEKIFPGDDDSLSNSD